MKPRSRGIKCSMPPEIFAGGLIWLELHTGNTLVIDLFVAIMVTGGIFWSLYATVMNQLFKNDQSWRFK